MVTTEEKKNFIRHVLKTYQMKRRECVWILNYILGNDELLERVEFVQEASKFDKGIVMGTVDGGSIAFRYYKGHIMTADAEKSFNDLRTSKDKFYIEINYPNFESCPHFRAVELEKVSDTLLPSTERLLEELKMFHMEHYINEALDNNDRELFQKLTAEGVENK